MTFQHTLSNKLSLTGCFFDTGFPEYLSATLFISAIKGGLMLSHTRSVLICYSLPNETIVQTSLFHFKVCFMFSRAYFREETYWLLQSRDGLCAHVRMSYKQFSGCTAKNYLTLKVFNNDSVVVRWGKFSATPGFS